MDIGAEKLARTLKPASRPGEDLLRFALLVCRANRRNNKRLLSKKEALLPRLFVLD